MRCTVPTDYTPLPVPLDLTRFIGKNVIITKSDGTVIYQGMLDNTNATAFALPSEDDYSILLKDTGAVDANLLNMVSSTVVQAAVFGTTQVIVLHTFH